LRLRRRRMRYDLVRTAERHEPRHQHQGDRSARHAPHSEPRDYPSGHSCRRRHRANVVLPRRIRSCRRRESTNVLRRHERPRRWPLRVRHRRHRISNATRDGRRRGSNTRRLLPAAALCRGRRHGGALALAATPPRAREELPRSAPSPLFARLGHGRNGYDDHTVGGLQRAARGVRFGLSAAVLRGYPRDSVDRLRTRGHLRSRRVRPGALSPGPALLARLRSGDVARRVPSRYDGTATSYRYSLIQDYRSRTRVRFDTGLLAAGQLRRHGRFGSNFHPGTRNCICAASSRDPRPCSW
jgi:hypothetical protein